jgi:hypothetical protein
MRSPGASRGDGQSKDLGSCDDRTRHSRNGVSLHQIQWVERPSDRVNLPYTKRGMVGRFNGRVVALLGKVRGLLWTVE